MEAGGGGKVYYELSQSQREQLAVEDDAGLGGNANLVGMVFWFDAGCPDEILERAVNRVAADEQAIRLRLARAEDGRAVQYETPFSYRTLPVERLDATRAASLERQRRAMNALAFGFDEPLCDFRIVRTDAEVGLRACFHHVIMDGRGILLFGALLTRHVGDLRAGAEPRGEPHRFTDSVEAEKRLVAGGRREADRRHWREATRDWTAPCLMNPAAGASKAPAGRCIVLEPGREFGRRLRGHCLRRSITPGNLFQAALAVYLWRRNPGARYADMGQTVASRRGAEEKETLGNFARELFLRVPVDGADTLAGAQEAAREAHFESLSRSLCGYEDVVAMTRERLPGISVMRDLMFTYIPQLERRDEVPDDDWLANDTPETSVEFLVYNYRDPERFTVVFDYRADVFSEAGARRALRFVMGLVDLCLADDSRTVREACEIVDGLEGEAPDGQPDGGPGGAKDELVARIVRRYADAPDLRMESRLQDELGLDSFDLVNIAADIREATGVKLSRKQLPALLTLADLVGLLRRAAAEGENREA